MNGTRPLLVSTDADLIDDVLRLAAANGVEVHLATETDAARSRWQLAPLVLVGADAAAALAGAGMGRRRDVVLVSRAPSPDDWQWAVAIGAEHVVSIPDGERWLIDRLADCGEGAPRDGSVLAVIAGSGGAGASTLAATLALGAAARSQRVLLVDGDCLGGGLDVLMGIEEAPGVRWSDLLEARGRLGAAALDQALPHVSGVTVLSWGRAGPTALPVDVVAAVLDAGVRGYDLVIADIARHLDAAGELLLSRADRTLLVCLNHVRASAASARLSAELQTRCTSVGLVLRSESRGVHEDTVGAALSVPIVGRLPTIRAVATRADEGEPPSLRDAYGRAALAVLTALERPSEHAADRARGGRDRRSA